MLKLYIAVCTVPGHQAAHIVRAHRESTVRGILKDQVPAGLDIEVTELPDRGEGLVYTLTGPTATHNPA